MQTKNGIMSALVVILISVVLWLFLGSLTSSHRVSPSAICQSNLKQIGLAYGQYIQDNGETFPPLSAGKEGWADILQPYLKSRRIFHCPSAIEPSAKFNSSDYFYNAQLARISLVRLDAVSRTILNGDGLASACTNAHISELPFEWLNDDNSPSYRHYDGANYGFADGHVKFLPPDWINAKSVKVSSATFAFN